MSFDEEPRLGLVASAIFGKPPVLDEGFRVGV